MCGITGIFNLDNEPASSVILQRMTNAIAHRGPDGEGFYVDGPIGLGHRRLAIIDLSPSGHQPMMTTDGNYVLIYNGEMYNFQEIRLELEAHGHQFHSRTDSEVVLHAYIQWGARCLDRFNGMFAFVIWDKTRKELFLARDRFGVKPLYYGLFGNTFLFGSEVKAMLQHPACSVNLDKGALLEYFTFQNIFTSRTFFTNVNLLPAGTFLRLCLEQFEIQTPTRYWDYYFSESKTLRDEREYIEELDRLLQQAIVRQLISDVDVGAYLSGGMDSGTITAVAATQLPYLKSFTCGFDLNSASGMEINFDERAKAEMMSYRFKTEHYEMVLKAGDLERVMPMLAWHIEEPRLGQSYPNYYAAQLASKFVKVCLSGGGGDEIFGGYPWRYYPAVINTGFDDYVDKYYSYWQRLIPNGTMEKVFKPIWSDVKHVQTRDIFFDVLTNHDAELTRPEDYINHSLYFEIKTFLHGLLVVEDKMSMAHGLETRVPFLDNDLVDFAMRLPVHLKLANLNEVVHLNENEAGQKNDKYFQRARNGKLALRKVMSRYLPAEIANSEKQGFSAPDASWFKGESMDYVRREILDPRAKIYDFMDYDAVHALVDEHLTGVQNRRLLIWSLLSFGWWTKNFLS